MPRSADSSSPTFVAPDRARGPARALAFREALRSPVRSAAFLARAWVAAIAVEGSLRVVGYKRTLRWIEAIPGRSSRRGAARTSVPLGERLVRRAYLAHAFEGGCLPQSLVQYLLHRRDGTDARLVVGVRRPAGANETGAPGIEAHAWVEGSEIPPIGAETFAPIFASGDSGHTDT